MRKTLVKILLFAALATAGAFSAYSVPSLRTKYLLWRIIKGPSASADEAFRELMKTQSPIVGKRIDEIEIAAVHYQVEEVIVSPQTSSAPIVVVIAEATETVVRGGKVLHISPSRSFYLLDGRGRTVEPFLRINLMLPESRFCDLNGDGVVDRIDSVGVQRDHGYVQILYVVPVTIEQRADLIIEYNRLPSNEVWSWRAIESRGSLPGRIVLGPESTSGVVTPRAEYTWSRSSGNYEGPLGGSGRNFQRISTVFVEHPEVVGASPATSNTPTDTESRADRSESSTSSSNIDLTETTESVSKPSLDDE